MTKGLFFILFGVVFLIIALGAFFSFRTALLPQYFSPPVGSVSGIEGSAEVSGEYASLAAGFAATLNQISPTPSVADEAWILKRVRFIAGQPKAYLEYTDTHIALRLLLEYYSLSGQLQTKVLATFVPNQQGGWTLQYGRDEAAIRPLFSYVFDGDASQWVPEITNP